MLVLFYIKEVTRDLPEFYASLWAFPKLLLVRVSFLSLNKHMLFKRRTETQNHGKEHHFLVEFWSVPTSNNEVACFHRYIKYIAGAGLFLHFKGGPWNM